MCKENSQELAKLENWNLGDILEKNLIIPNYQRTYCWSDKQVNLLLDDLREFFLETDNDNDVYVMSTVILHEHEPDKSSDSYKYDIVDGQQRLITLALILYGIHKRNQQDGTKKQEASEIKNDENWRPDNCSLLNQSFGDEQNLIKLDEKKLSQPAIHVIHNMKNIDKRLSCLENLTIKKILERIHFSVIIISNDNLDLAYTFFTQNNNRGKPLTDYDLLKANHLRYLTSPSEKKQASYVSKRWDQMIINAEISRINYKKQQKKDTQGQIEKKQNDMDYLGFDFESTEQIDFSLPYVRVLDLYLFRLRRWFRHEKIEDAHSCLNRRIKDEFMPAPIIEELPPSGGQLKFEECIHGGAYFFGYIDYFIHKFNSFRNTPAFRFIHSISQAKNLTRNGNLRYNYRYHDFYRNIMEAHLFAYYLKFHDSYLSEAALLIVRKIAHLRYIQGSARGNSIHSDPMNFNMVSLLQSSSSPTFYLGKLKQDIELLQDEILNEKDVKGNFKMLVDNGIKELESSLYLTDIKQSINNVYLSNKKNS